MNKIQKGFMKIVGGITVVLVMFFVSLAFNHPSQPISAISVMIAIACLYVSIWGLIDYGKAMDQERIDERRKNTGKLATADDVRKALGADWMNFTVKRIGLVTDKDKHLCTTLAKIYIYHAFAGERLIEIEDKTKTIVTPQQLEEEKHYIVNNLGNIKQIEELV